MADLSKIALGGTTYNLKDTGCRESLALLEAAQQALSADQASIDVLSTSYVLTSDTKFLRYKSYYSYDDVNETYTQLVRGTDYDVGDEVDTEAVYEVQGHSISDIRGRLNSVITVVNALMPAHRAAAPANNENNQDTGDSEGE